MAEKRSRRRFTAEFKAQAVRRLLEGGKGLSEVAAELGLGAGQLSCIDDLVGARRRAAGLRPGSDLNNGGIRHCWRIGNAIGNRRGRLCNCR